MRIEKFLLTAHLAYNNEIMKGESPYKNHKYEPFQVQQPIDNEEKGSPEFSKYADPNDYNVMNIEGLVKFFTDLGIDGESVDSLYLLYIMDTEELNIIKQSEFFNLLSKAGVSSAAKAKNYVRDEIKRINNSEAELK